VRRIALPVAGNGSDVTIVRGRSTLRPYVGAGTCSGDTFELADERAQLIEVAIDGLRNIIEEGQQVWCGIEFVEAAAEDRGEHAQRHEILEQPIAQRPADVGRSGCFGALSCPCAILTGVLWGHAGSPRLSAAERLFSRAPLQRHIGSAVAVARVATFGR
jgi:hypothetical protein